MKNSGNARCTSRKSSVSALIRILTELDRRISRNRLLAYRPYPKQRDFHEAGRLHRERLFMAGNQLGKTWAGGFECAMHLTGRYPDWWKGRRYARPVRLWAASVTGESTRDNPQRILLGPPAIREQWGTGTIPGDAIDHISLSRGVADAVDSIVVRHGSGGQSSLTFKAFGMGREKWQVARRYINGQTMRYIEYMEAPLPDDGDQAGAFYVDSGLTGVSETPQDEFSGLGHLEGETVQILADGASHPDRAVEEGKVTLDRVATVVQAGLPYDHLSQLQTLNLEAGAADGTAQGKTKRITNCTIRFHRSLGVKIGPDEDTLDPVSDLMFRHASTPMGTPNALFTGDSFVAWPGGYDTEARVTIVPVGAFPCTVVAIYPQLITQDR